MLAITVLTSLFVFPSLAIMLPIYVQDVLQLDIDAMAMVMAVSGLGSLIGSVVLLSIPRDRQLSRLFAGAMLLVLSLSALAWARWLPLALLATGLLSLGISTAMGLASTRIQEQVRPELRGRVMGLFSLAFMGVIPFSGLAATALADLIGLPIVMQASALLYALGALILWARLRTPSAAVALPRGRSSE
jgi:predicted MFS family arabinose efflux permease